MAERRQFFEEIIAKIRTTIIPEINVKTPTNKETINKLIDIISEGLTKYSEQLKNIGKIEEKVIQRESKFIESQLTSFFKNIIKVAEGLEKTTGIGGSFVDELLQIIRAVSELNKVSTELVEFAEIAEKSATSLSQSSQKLKEFVNTLLNLSKLGEINFLSLDNLRKALTSIGDLFATTIPIYKRIIPETSEKDTKNIQAQLQQQQEQLYKVQVEYISLDKLLSQIIDNNQIIFYKLQRLYQNILENNVIFNYLAKKIEQETGKEATKDEIREYFKKKNEELKLDLQAVNEFLKTLNSFLYQISKLYSFLQQQSPETSVTDVIFQLFLFLNKLRSAIVEGYELIQGQPKILLHNLLGEITEALIKVPAIDTNVIAKKIGEIGNVLNIVDEIFKTKIATIEASQERLHIFYTKFIGVINDFNAYLPKIFESFLKISIPEQTLFIMKTKELKEFFDKFLVLIQNINNKLVSLGNVKINEEFQSKLPYFFNYLETLIKILEKAPNLSLIIQNNYLSEIVKSDKIKQINEFFTGFFVYLKELTKTFENLKYIRIDLVRIFEVGLSELTSFINTLEKIQNTLASFEEINTLLNSTLHKLSTFDITNINNFSSVLTTKIIKPLKSFTKKLDKIVVPEIETNTALTKLNSFFETLYNFTNLIIKTSEQFSLPKDIIGVIETRLGDYLAVIHKFEEIFQSETLDKYFSFLKNLSTKFGIDNLNDEIQIFGKLVSVIISSVDNFAQLLKNINQAKITENFLVLDNIERLVKVIEQYTLSLSKIQETTAKLEKNLLNTENIEKVINLLSKHFSLISSFVTIFKSLEGSMFYYFKTFNLKAFEEKLYLFFGLIERNLFNLLIKIPERIGSLKLPDKIPQNEILTLLSVLEFINDVFLKFFEKVLELGKKTETKNVSNLLLENIKFYLNQIPNFLNTLSSNILEITRTFKVLEERYIKELKIENIEAVLTKTNELFRLSENIFQFFVKIQNSLNNLKEPLPPDTLKLLKNLSEALDLIYKFVEIISNIAKTREKFIIETDYLLFIKKLPEIEKIFSQFIRSIFETTFNLLRQISQIEKAPENATISMEKEIEKVKKALDFFTGLPINIQELLNKIQKDTAQLTTIDENELTKTLDNSLRAILQQSGYISIINNFIQEIQRLLTKQTNTLKSTNIDKLLSLLKTISYENKEMVDEYSDLNAVIQNLIEEINKSELRLANAEFIKRDLVFLKEYFKELVYFAKNLAAFSRDIMESLSLMNKYSQLYPDLDMKLFVSNTISMLSSLLRAFKVLSAQDEQFRKELREIFESTGKYGKQRKNLLIISGYAKLFLSDITNVYNSILSLTGKINEIIAKFDKIPEIKLTEKISDKLEKLSTYIKFPFIVLSSIFKAFKFSEKEVGNLVAYKEIISVLEDISKNEVLFTAINKIFENFIKFIPVLNKLFEYQSKLPKIESGKYKGLVDLSFLRMFTNIINTLKSFDKVNLEIDFDKVQENFNRIIKVLENFLNFEEQKQKLNISIAEIIEKISKINEQIPKTKIQGKGGEKTIIDTGLFIFLVKVANGFKDFVQNLTKIEDILSITDEQKIQERINNLVRMFTLFINSITGLPEKIKELGEKLVILGTSTDTTRVQTYLGPLIGFLKIFTSQLTYENLKKLSEIKVEPVYFDANSLKNLMNALKQIVETISKTDIPDINEQKLAKWEKIFKSLNGLKIIVNAGRSSVESLAAETDKFDLSFNKLNDSFRRFTEDTGNFLNQISGSVSNVFDYIAVLENTYNEALKGLSNIFKEVGLQTEELLQARNVLNVFKSPFQIMQQFFARLALSLNKPNQTELQIKKEISELANSFQNAFIQALETSLTTLPQNIDAKAKGIIEKVKLGFLKIFQKVFEDIPNIPTSNLSFYVKEFETLVNSMLLAINNQEILTKIENVFNDFRSAFVKAIDKTITDIEFAQKKILENNKKLEELFEESFKKLSESLDKSQEVTKIEKPTFDAEKVKEQIQNITNELALNLKNFRETIAENKHLSDQELNNFTQIIKTNIEKLEKYLKEAGFIDETINKLLAPLKDNILNTVNGLNKSFDTLNKSLEKLVRESKALEMIQRVDKVIADLDDRLQRLSWKLFQFSWAFIYINMYGDRAVYTLERFFKNIIDISKELQLVQVRLKGLNVNISSFLSYTTDQFKKLLDISIRTPFSIMEITEAFTQMKAVGIDNINIFEKVVDTAISFGFEVSKISDDIARALQGDATAFKNLRHSIGLTNVTIKELGGSVSSSGRLMNTTFSDIQRNAIALLKYLDRYAGASENTMNTLAQAFTNLQDAIKVLYVEASKSLGILTDIANFLATSILKLYKDSENFFTAFSKGIANLSLLVLAFVSLLRPILFSFDMLNNFVFMFMGAISGTSLILQNNIINTKELIKNLRAMGGSFELLRLRVEALEDAYKNLLNLTESSAFTKMQNFTLNIASSLASLVNFFLQNWDKVLKSFVIFSAIFTSLNAFKNILKTGSELQNNLDKLQNVLLNNIKTVEMFYAEDATKLNKALKDIIENTRNMEETFGNVTEELKNLGHNSEHRFIKLYRDSLLANKGLKELLKTIRELSNLSTIKFEFVSPYAIKQITDLTESMKVLDQNVMKSKNLLFEIKTILWSVFYTLFLSIKNFNPVGILSRILGKEIIEKIVNTSLVQGLTNVFSKLPAILKTVLKPLPFAEIAMIFVDIFTWIFTGRPLKVSLTFTIANLIYNAIASAIKYLSPDKLSELSKGISDFFTNLFKNISLAYETLEKESFINQFFPKEQRDILIKDLQKINESFKELNESLKSVNPEEFSIAINKYVSETIPNLVNVNEKLKETLTKTLDEYNPKIINAFKEGQNLIEQQQKLIKKLEEERNKIKEIKKLLTLEEGLDPDKFIDKKVKHTLEANLANIQKEELRIKNKIDKISKDILNKITQYQEKINEIIRAVEPAINNQVQQISTIVQYYELQINKLKEIREQWGDITIATRQYVNELRKLLEKELEDYSLSEIFLKDYEEIFKTVLTFQSNINTVIGKLEKELEPFKTLKNELVDFQKELSLGKVNLSKFENIIQSLNNLNKTIVQNKENVIKLNEVLLNLKYSQNKTDNEIKQLIKTYNELRKSVDLPLPETLTEEAAKQIIGNTKALNDYIKITNDYLETIKDYENLLRYINEAQKEFNLNTEKAVQFIKELNQVTIEASNKLGKRLSVEAVTSLELFQGLNKELFKYQSQLNSINKISFSLSRILKNLQLNPSLTLDIIKLYNNSRNITEFLGNFLKLYFPKEIDRFIKNFGTAYQEITKEGIDLVKEIISGLPDIKEIFKDIADNIEGSINKLKSFIRELELIPNLLKTEKADLLFETIRKTIDEMIPSLENISQIEKIILYNSILTTKQKRELLQVINEQEKRIKGLDRVFGILKENFIELYKTIGQIPSFKEISNVFKDFVKGQKELTELYNEIVNIIKEDEFRTLIQSQLEAFKNYFENSIVKKVEDLVENMPFSSTNIVNFFSQGIETIKKAFQKSSWSEMYLALVKGGEKIKEKINEAFNKAKNDLQFIKDFVEDRLKDKQGKSDLLLRLETLKQFLSPIEYAQAKGYLEKLEQDKNEEGFGIGIQPIKIEPVKFTAFSNEEAFLAILKKAEQRIKVQETQTIQRISEIELLQKTTNTFGTSVNDFGNYVKEFGNIIKQIYIKQEQKETKPLPQNTPTQPNRSPIFLPNLLYTSPNQFYA